MKQKRNAGWIAAGIAASMALVLSCGGGFKTGNPWEAGEERFFDDGIDLIGDLGKLSGEWAFRVGEDLEGRVFLADFVGVVRVLSVQVTRDLDGQEARRIEVALADSFYGVPLSETIDLSSDRRSPGYSLILRHEHYLTGSHILFVRWFETTEDKIGHHFHLSPATPEMITTVEKLAKKRKREEERRQFSGQ